MGKKNVVDKNGVGGEILKLTEGDISVPFGEGTSGQAKVDMDGAGVSNSREGLEEGEMKEGPDMGVMVVAAAVFDDGAERTIMNLDEGGEVGKKTSVDEFSNGEGLNATKSRKSGLD